MTEVIYIDPEKLAIRFDYDPIKVQIVKSMPSRRWNASERRWEFPPLLKNFEFIDQYFDDYEIDWEDEAEAIRVEVYKSAKLRADTDESRDQWDEDNIPEIDLEFKFEPKWYQAKALALGNEQDTFAYLMDQGLGKTKVALDDAALNFQRGKINALLVLAPNSVKTNWVDPENEKDEVLKHWPENLPYVKHCWSSKMTKAEKTAWAKFKATWGSPVMHILSANVEGLAHDRIVKELQEYIDAHSTMIVVDEATRIGNHAAKRTKNATKLRKNAAMARILTGTPIIKSPMKAFSQFGFLDKNILGHSSFYSFRNHFAVMGRFGPEYFINLDELSNKIRSASYRITKPETGIAFPPQEFQRREITLSDAQFKCYKQMQEEMYTYNSKSQEITVSIVLSQMLRLQQITSGYLPLLDPETGEVMNTVEIIDPSKNPKFKEVMNILDESGDQKVIVWTRFKHDITGLSKLFDSRGVTHRLFYGGVSEDDRRKNRQDFANDPNLKAIIGNPAAGGLGIDEFKAASIVIYLANSPSTEERIQSEDRTHRIGSEIHDKISYYDIVAPHTVDDRIIQIMRGDVELSNEIMKDGWRQWI